MMTVITWEGKQRLVNLLSSYLGVEFIILQFFFFNFFFFNFSACPSRNKLCIRVNGFLVSLAARWRILPSVSSGLHTCDVIDFLVHGKITAILADLQNSVVFNSFPCISCICLSHNTPTLLNHNNNNNSNKNQPKNKNNRKKKQKTKQAGEIQCNVQGH